MEVKESDLIKGPYPLESTADKKRMEQVAPVFKLLAQALQDLVHQHDAVKQQFIAERTAAGEPTNNNAAQVELVLRQEEATKSFDPGIQALYETLKILRLIGRREEAVEAHWLKVYQKSKDYERKGKLSPSEIVAATIAVKELRSGEGKLLTELEQSLLKAKAGSDLKAQQAAETFLAQLPTLRQVLDNAKSSCCISRGLKWLKNC